MMRTNNVLEQGLWYIKDVCSQVHCRFLNCGLFPFFPPIYVFIYFPLSWNALYLMRTWGVPDVGTASWVQHSFLSDGTWISPWEVFNIPWKLKLVKPYQSLSFMQSQLKWVLCTQNLFTKCRNPFHIFMWSRNLPSVLSATVLQGVRNMLLYPLEANLLGKRHVLAHIFVPQRPLLCK